MSPRFLHVDKQVAVAWHPCTTADLLAAIWCNTAHSDYLTYKRKWLNLPSMTPHNLWTARRKAQTDDGWLKKKSPHPTPTLNPTSEPLGESLTQLRWRVASSTVQ